MAKKKTWIKVPHTALQFHPEAPDKLNCARPRKRHITVFSFLYKPYQDHNRFFRASNMVTAVHTTTEIRPSRDLKRSFHVKGSETFLKTSLNCCLVSSSGPELSITMSASDFFQSNASCALILFWACSSEHPSLDISLWIWVSGLTQTTITGFVHRSILVSNSSGMSRMITLHPFIHSFAISQSMPQEICGARRLKQPESLRQNNSHEQWQILTKE